MEISLEEILFNSSTRKHYNRLKILSFKQLKEFLDYKIDDKILLEICRFIQSNYKQDKMIRFIRAFLIISQNDWLNITETCTVNQFNIYKKTKKQIDKINEMVIKLLEELKNYSDSDSLTNSELLEKLKNIKELSISKFNFEK